MAFNLEFKITYDELAPSLQDMFKSLQGQITDNRNEITNINLDISDITNEINNINNHLTQIDNSITNIENNIDQIENNIQNIENDITNIEGDITEINKNITNIEGDITNIQGDISNIENNITQIEGDITNIQETVTVIQGMTADGEQGQVVKIDKNAGTEGALFADDNFHEMLVFENDTEIENFKSQYDYNVSMQEIFDTWQQNNCANNSCLDACGWGLHEYGNQININVKDNDWSYSDGYINMKINKSLYSMFISNTIYQANTYIEIMIAAIDKIDDDVCGIILGYKQVGNNEMHTLSYIQGPNHNQSTNTSKGWQYSSLLAYDFCQPTYKFLIIQKHDNNFNNNTDRYITKFKIVKSLNTVTVSRARFYATEDEVLKANYDYNATYTLPSSKPSDMDQTTYNNLKEMFSNSKIGFSTFSWNCKFKIISSNTGLMEESLYNLNNDTIQTLQNGTWVTQSQKVSEVVPYRVFLYNDYTDTLFFYYYKQTYCKIATSGGG